MAEKRTGTVIPTGILQPTTQRDEPSPPLKAVDQEGRGDDDGADDPAPESRPSRRRSKVVAKAETGKTEGRRLYLSEGVHFRLRLYAYQKGVKLSDAAEELLDKALPKWDVNRVG